MNHIRCLQNERDALHLQLVAIHRELTELRSYCMSDKFREHDHAYVRTDILPRLDSLNRLVCAPLETTMAGMKAMNCSDQLVIFPETSEPIRRQRGAAQWTPD